MVLDPQRVRFKGKAISAAIEVGGSLDHPDAAPFFDALYSEWLASGRSLPEAEAWLRERFVEAFPSIAAVPVWVEDEPTWPFYDGKPMTFLVQTPTGVLSPGETVYVF